MHRIALRGAFTVMLAATLLLVAGCAGPIFRVKVVNEGDFPLTAVRFVPVLDDADDQAQAFDDAVNLLPRDADNVTIALAPGKQTMLPHLLEGALYYIAVTYFIDGVYVQDVWDTPLLLTDIQDKALLTLWFRCFYPENATTPVFEYYAEY